MCGFELTFACAIASRRLSTPSDELTLSSAVLTTSVTATAAMTEFMSEAPQPAEQKTP